MATAKVVWASYKDSMHGPYGFHIYAYLLRLLPIGIGEDACANSKRKTIRYQENHEKIMHMHAFYEWPVLLQEDAFLSISLDTSL